jgi:hypothetical protein
MVSFTENAAATPAARVDALAKVFGIPAKLIDPEACGG